MDEMLFAHGDGIATLTVNRPEQRNAMTWAMYERLVELCDIVEDNDEIRVWIIRGAGDKAFVSGTDISQFPAFQGNPQAGIEYEAKIDRVVGRLASVKKPTVAHIDGYAVGGGLMIALNCDLRIATPASQFSIPSVKLGNCLSMQNYAKLVELIGPARTLELMYTGRMITAQEAARFGMLNEVASAQNIEGYVTRLAGQIAQSAPITVMVSKEAVRRITRDSVPDGKDLIRACYNSRDFQEGVSAFLEKREPRWEGV